MEEYKVEQDDDVRGLTRKVEAEMRRGWRLQGGIVVDTNPNTGERTFFQALAK